MTLGPSIAACPAGQAGAAGQCATSPTPLPSTSQCPAPWTGVGSACEMVQPPCPAGQVAAAGCQTPPSTSSCPQGEVGTQVDWGSTGDSYLPWSPYCANQPNPLAASQTESPPPIAQPNRALLPVFSGPIDGGYFKPPNDSRNGYTSPVDFQPPGRPSQATVAIGGGTIYVAARHTDDYTNNDYNLSKVFMFNADTLAYVGAFDDPPNPPQAYYAGQWPDACFSYQPAEYAINQPVGISYYRGEVFVSEACGARVLVYDSNGHFKRQFLTSIAQSFVPNGYAGRILRPAGLDVAWGEVWVKLQGTFDVQGSSPCAMSSPSASAWDTPNAQCSLVGVYDAATGALKALIPHVVRYGCPAGSSNGASSDANQCEQTATYPTQPPDDGSARYGNWDVATSPDTNGVFAQCRMIQRNNLLTQLSIDDLITPDSSGDCPNSRYLEGVTEVWGMKWLLAASGDPGTWTYNQDTNSYSYTPNAGRYITEYDLTNNTGLPFQPLTQARRWQPMDAASNNYRDVAYTYRGPRIDWAGHPTQSNWQHGNQCLYYVVSDADIFVIGYRGEHWYDLARNFGSINFTLDGQPFNPPISSTSPYGQICIPEDTVPSGVHTLGATATADGQTVTKANTSFRIDHDPPIGTISPQPPYVRQTITLAGNATDAQSGLNTAQLQTSPHNANNWNTACSSPNLDTSGNISCQWDTTTVPDGTYDIRAVLTDNVTPDYGGTNTGYTTPVTTTVDNTPPAVTNTSPDLYEDGYETNFRGQDEIHLTHTDAASGLAQTTVSVNTATDGSERGSWRTIGTSSSSGDATLNWDTRSMPDGFYRFDARTCDQVGNCGDYKWQGMLARHKRRQLPESTNCADGTQCYAGQKGGSGASHNFFTSFGTAVDITTPSPITQTSDVSYEAIWNGVGSDSGLYDSHSHLHYPGQLQTGIGTFCGDGATTFGQYVEYFLPGGSGQTRYTECFTGELQTGERHNYKVAVLHGSHRSKALIDSHAKVITQNAAASQGQPEPTSGQINSWKKRGYLLNKLGNRNTSALAEVLGRNQSMAGRFDNWKLRLHPSDNVTTDFHPPTQDNTAIAQDPTYRFSGGIASWCTYDPSRVPCR
jgi:hypothetical protein